MKKEQFVPVAILFAGIVISVTIFVTHPHLAAGPNGDPELTRPVDATDHILGNPAAPVVVIEYSDIDSEYSKDFQQVMEQVMQNYGTNGNVAWVYRDFPLITQDPNSEEDDEAAECVAALGTPSDFFSFIDAVQAAAPGDNQFDPANYDTIVSTLGLSTGTFDDCVSAHTYQKKSPQTTTTPYLLVRVEVRTRYCL